jgi:hypothetical protein
MIAETSTYADLPLAPSFRFGDLAELPPTFACGRPCRPARQSSNTSMTVVNEVVLAEGWSV